MPAKKVLSLGQCGADGPRIAHLLRSQFAAEVVHADTFDDALAELRRQLFDLVLVNRILDANGASGLEFVGRLKGEVGLARVPVMLVSNHDDAQQQAVDSGSCPASARPLSDTRGPFPVERDPGVSAPVPGAWKPTKQQVAAAFGRQCRT